MCSFGRDTHGKLFIAPPNAVCVELLSRYNQKLFLQVAISFTTGGKQWKIIIEV